MNHTRFTFCLIPVMIISAFAGCNKETTKPFPGSKNKSPVALGGFDKFITFLQPDSFILDAGASYDPEGEALSFKWTVLKAPSNFSIANANAKRTSVAYTQEGYYSIELSVTDPHQSTSKDTVVVAVSLPLGGNSIVVNNLIWSCSVECALFIGGLSNLPPSGLNVYIKRDNSVNWELVSSEFVPGVNYVYGLSVNELVIVQNNGLSFLDTPDVRIEY